MKYLLETKNLTKSFFLPCKKFFAKKRKIKAVNNVSIKIKQGETLGIVGESGSGKTTLGRLILKLTNLDKGSIFFEGNNVTKLNEKEFRSFRSKMQMVFQHPYDSLNPRMTINEILAEGIKNEKTRKQKNKKTKKLLNLVGLADKSLNSYPHEFSGGERQRIVIARALAMDPKFIICDEPVSNLDVIIQSQILDLLQNLQKELGLTYLFITHDLAVASHMCNRIAVIKKGRIIEEGQHILSCPRTKYARELLNCLPSLVRKKKEINIKKLMIKLTVKMLKNITK